MPIAEPPEPPHPESLAFAPAPARRKSSAGQTTIRLLALYLLVGVSMTALFWFTRDRTGFGALYFWSGFGALVCTIQGTGLILREGRSESE